MAIILGWGGSALGLRVDVALVLGFLGLCKQDLERFAFFEALVALDQAGAAEDPDDGFARLAPLVSQS